MYLSFSPFYYYSKSNVFDIMYDIMYVHNNFELHLLNTEKNTENKRWLQNYIRQFCHWHAYKTEYCLKVFLRGYAET